MQLTMNHNPAPVTPLEKAQLDYLNAVNQTHSAMRKLAPLFSEEIDRLELRLTRPTLTLAGPRQPKPLERARRIIREATATRSSVSAMFAYVIALDREAVAQKACMAAHQ